MKFIFVGDYRQLEPVAEGGFDYENSTVTKTLCDNNKLVLTINKRSDDTMTTISDYAYDHVYCKSCISKWLKTHDTCPCCREELEDENMANIIV